MFNFFTDHKDIIIFISAGCKETIEYSFISVIFGFLIGNIIFILKFSKIKILELLADFYISIFRGTPLLIQLSIIYFALPQILNIKLDIFTAAIISFSLNSSAYVAEIIRGGIQAIDKGQFEAARALDIPYFYMMKDIMLPQSYRNILPSLVNEFINLIKESAIVSLIGGMDIMRRANMMAAEHYDYFTPMIIAGFCYYIIIFILSRLVKIIEKRMKI